MIYIIMVQRHWEGNFLLWEGEDTKKEEFVEYIKSNVAKGYPVIALGIIGPPEPCIVAGYELSGDVVVGWNFFQNDDEFSSEISFMDNGYFRCDKWWENTDTQAVMCIGPIIETNYGDKEILDMASKIIKPRDEFNYAKGLNAYDAWNEMLLDEKWFENGSGFDYLFSKLLVQNDAMTCICDGRKWGAKYFEELSEKYGETEKAICKEITKHFRQVSNMAGEMISIIGDWSDVEKMINNFANRTKRERIGKLINSAKLEDTKAYEQIKKLLSKI